MNNFLKNQKGTIAVSCFLLGLLILMLVMSAYTIFTNDYYATLSNSHATKAYFLVEAALEEILFEIVGNIDGVVVLYLENLRNYKIEYLLNSQENNSIEYSPPALDYYIQNHFTQSLQDYNRSIENPFSEYSHPHSYKITVAYEEEEGILLIEGIGVYNNARRRIQAQLMMPKATVMGQDLFNLPKVEVSPLKVLTYYQGIILSN